jgi:hypothetical protein
VRILWVLLALTACQRGPTDAPKLKPPEPLPRLLPTVLTDAGASEEEAREALFRVGPFVPTGPGVPGKAARIVVEENAATINGAKIDLEDAAALGKALAALGGAPVLISSKGETWITHLGPLLAALDDGKVETWFQHPDVMVAFEVKLFDAAAFSAWLDEPVPGKVRVIQRADGFELTTGMGKLLAADPNGPSVPVRGGMMDLPTLQRGLSLVKRRFKNATDLCFMPSFGTPVADAVRPMAANWVGHEGPIFEKLCFVYARPGAADAGR